MLNAIISYCLYNRLLVLAAWAGIAAAGVFAMRALPIDAFPDTTPVQVQINTIAPAMGPEEIERLITFPIEQSISGLPNLKEVRSTSKFGLSQVIVTFNDGADILTSRNLINERLGIVELPGGMPRPKMGPIATGLGEVLHYAVMRADQPEPIVLPKGAESLRPPLALAGGGMTAATIRDRDENLMELRTIHDWIIKPVLRTVSGTAEVNSWGGMEQQYQIRVDPEKLIKYGVTFRQIQDAVQASNFNVGGGIIRERGEGISVLGKGHLATVDELGKIVIDARGGTPVYLNQIAELKIGAEIRRGAVTADGQGEIVLGLGFMLMGENSHDVTRRLTDKLEEVKQGLPPGVKIVKLYDRTELVDHVIATVRRNLFEGGLLVVSVLFVFLGNLRAGLIVAAAIPMSILCAFLGMERFAIAGSLLSLGAIDFGLVVDSSIVLVENCVSHMAHGDKRGDQREVVRAAAIEVRKPTLFGELIILIVYIPILTLDGVAGKMFRPMALTVIFALLGSLIASITLMPVLISFLGREPWWRRLGCALYAWMERAAAYFPPFSIPLHAVGRLAAHWPKRNEEDDPMPVVAARSIVLPMLRGVLNHRVAALGVALAGLGIAMTMARGRGSEFVPTLSEGAFVLNVKRLAGVDIGEVIRRNTLMERSVLAKFPNEVAHIWSRCGVAEVATDPMGVEETDMFISLTPRERWAVLDKDGKRIETQLELLKLIKDELDDQPGQVIGYSQPIQQRTDEMASGSKANIAIKVFGDDFKELTRISAEIERILKEVSPEAEVSMEQLSGAPVLEIELNLAQMSKYNLPARTVLDYVESLGSKMAGDVITGNYRFPLIIRLSERWRDKVEIEKIPIPTPTGEIVPLGRLTNIRQREGPAAISREWSRRRTVIQCNVKDDDIVGFVSQARKRIAREVRMPAGGRYRVEFGGAYEYFESAMNRLKIVVPLALAAIFALLYLTFNNFRDSLRVYTGVPFAIVGGVIAMEIRNMPFSVSAAVGFIALFGVSVLNSMLLVTFVKQKRESGMELNNALYEAVKVRLRPVLMTALVASLGFLPMALSTGMGAEVQRPLATVVIGGVISSTIMTLLVLPAAYRLFGSN